MRIFLSLLGIFVVITLIFYLLAYIGGQIDWKAAPATSALIVIFIWLGLREAKLV